MSQFDPSLAIVAISERSVELIVGLTVLTEQSHDEVSELAELGLHSLRKTIDHDQVSGCN